jgi:uncharacterized protein (DUF58 family)
MAARGSDAMRLMQPQVLAGLSNLELIARAVVEGFLVGLHRSPLFGFSQEFAEYRPYTPGDDPRFIDWNVYARSERTYIKRFLGETNSHLVILLDASASMGYSPAGGGGAGGGGGGAASVTKFRYAQILAASLAYIASRQHDAVGLMVFDEEVRDYRAPSGRSGQLASVLHAIDRAQPARATRLHSPFERFREHIARRGMVAMISDFYFEPSALLESVRPLAFQGQDLVLFQVMDPAELAPDLKESTLLEDVETGQAVEVSPEFAQQQYPERVRAHIRALREAATGVGADHVLLETTQPLDKPLRNYLLFRERRR